MEGVTDCVQWEQCQLTTKRQHWWGTLCALLLALALGCVLDGLQALRRNEANLLELLPGESVAVSGPIAIRNPTSGDILTRFSPEEASLSFSFDGFFTGYIFGSGMWRGKVLADAGARPGRYILHVRFRGTPGSAVQRYPVRIYADADDMRAASFSCIRRFVGQNPFMLAAGFCVVGLSTGLVVFLLGQRHIRQLRALGCGEVVMVRREGRNVCLWCLLYGQRAPAPGAQCAVLNSRGEITGRAHITAVRKGTLEMRMADTAYNVAKGCLVLLHPQQG